MKIDLNCDLGEGFGRYDFGVDSELMKNISSANIACGFHAGDPSTMSKTVEMAVRNGVKIGAHPGYPDLQGFGRRGMDLSPKEVEAIVVYQIGALSGFVKAQGSWLHHVKAHGALYNKASQDMKTALAIVEAVKSIDPNLIIYGPYNSALEEAAKQKSLRFQCEFFADRAYEKNGELVPRGQYGALIHDVGQCAKRIERVIQDKCVETIGGQVMDMKAETICVHGDNDRALDFIRALKEKLQTLGCEVG